MLTCRFTHLFVQILVSRVQDQPFCTPQQHFAAPASPVDRSDCRCLCHFYQLYASWDRRRISFPPTQEEGAAGEQIVLQLVQHLNSTMWLLKLCTLLKKIEIFKIFRCNWKSRIKLTCWSCQESIPTILVISFSVNFSPNLNLRFFNYATQTLAFPAQNVS